MEPGCPSHLFRPDVLKLPGRVQEVVGISLRCKLARVGLLNKVLVTLLLSKVNSILLAREVDVGALHKITRRLPTDQRVLPSMSLGKNIPIHSPASTAPVAGLSRRLSFLVDAVVIVSS